MLREATDPAWTQPRQVRLRGVPTKEAQLQLEALGSAGGTYPCTIELRDGDGKRFFLSQARIVELKKKNGNDPTLVVDVNVVLVIDPPEEERQRATLAECERLRRAPHPKHGRVRRADVEKRDTEIRKMRAAGTPTRVIADVYGISNTRVAQILNENGHPLEKPEEPAAP